MRNWVKNSLEKLKHIEVRASINNAFSRLKQVSIKAWAIGVIDKFKRVPEIDDTPQLLPLYPTHEANDHKIYVQTLNRALDDQDIHNIALTGSYGSGKSSILKDFVNDKKDRTISISFSTLGASIDKYTNIDPADSKKNDLDNTANLIQKEVVKQILYREKYDNIPASRYPKISKIRFWKTIYWALALTVAFPALMFATGKLKIAELDRSRTAILMGLVFLISFVVVRIVLTLTKRLQLEKLSGGPVSIALSSSNNYFDQYLDEIIYFFEATKYDIVVFEDIDRFNDLYIFENLRQLNNLLNSSKQVVKQIRFIFAVKDSIFSVENSLSDGNRTKFFDLIIPTVPFITDKNSRDVMADMFNKEYEIERSVIAITSKYITDMRLVKNIYNEFKIFNEKIIKGGKIDELSASNLFATIVFKNVYLKDFEEIRVGDSKLEKIYDASRRFIESRYESLNNQVTELRQQINTFSDIDYRCEQYGLKLIALTQKQLDDNDGYLVSYTVNGVAYTRSDVMQTKDFWVNLSKVTTDDAIALSYQQKSNRYGGVVALTLTKASIEQVIGNKLDTDLWLEADVQPLKTKLTTAEKSMESIRGHNIKSLMQTYSSFNDTVSELTGGGLLHELVAAGYIDANYALYTSIYREENVSAKGMNFIVHNIQANKKDLAYKFDGDDDIKNMLDDLDSVYFENRNIYNFDILDYLLKAKDSRADLIVKMMSGGTPDDIDFLNRFIENGDQADLLIAKLAKQWPGLFSHIVGNEAFTDDTKNHLLDVAILNGDPEVSYVTSNAISEYLSKHSNDIANLKTNKSKEYTDIASTLLAHFDVQLLAVNGFKNKSLLEFVEANDLYEINANNIEALTGSKDLSLSNVKKLKPQVYEYLCKHLDQYLEMIDGNADTKFSVGTSEDLVEILNKSKAQQTEVLNILIETASDDCYIDQINEVDSKVWSSLFVNFRVTNTLPNVIDYYTFREETLDEPLIEYLNTVENLVENDIIEDQVMKKAFAISVLNSSIKTEVKAAIVKDLLLTEPIKPSEFKGQNGKLYGLLVESAVILDSEVTYNSLVNMSWETKEQYIVKSAKFDEYIASATLSTEDINGIAASSLVRPSIKNYLIDNIATYKDLMSISSASNLAKFAVENSRPVNAVNLNVILDGPDERTSAQLVYLSLSLLSRDDLLAVLPLIRGEYAKLALTNKHPSFEYTDYNIGIAKRLQELNIVSSYEQKKEKLKVNTRRSFN